MNLPRFAPSHQAIVLTFVALLLAAGLFNFLTMSRREDPEITIRDALVITVWPGASATKVEELLTDPLEKAITQIAEVEKITSKSMVGLSIIQVTAEDRVIDTDQVWDEVRAKVTPVTARFPQGVWPPLVNSDFGDVYAVTLALYQVPMPGEPDIQRPYSPRQLEVFAERIEDELELVDSVAKVDFWGVQPERIYVEVDSADWAKIGVTEAQLRDLFEARNIVEPGGELDTPQGRYAVNPTGEFTAVAQMNDLVVGRLDGQLPVRLSDLPIRIDRRYEEPARTLTRFTSPEVATAAAPHVPCLVLGISMKGGHNVVQMGEAVDQVLRRLQGEVLPPDLRLTRVNDLPRQVNTRIQNFRNNLLQGVVIVLGVALLMMGWRPALIMATAVPLSMIVAIAVVRPLGIELEEFSIASLIIALGMVVDNAIVISDNCYRLIREGVPKREAIIKGTQELSIPIFTSTLTTICAFLPMLTIIGNVGEYVSSLPIVVAATLASSYVIAMLVTPIMCLWLLKPPPPTPTSVTATSAAKPPRYDRFMSWCLDHKGRVFGSAVAIFAASLLLIPVIGNQFFPAGLRDQFFIKVWLPEGSPIAATAEVCNQIEQVLLGESPRAVGGARAVGGPRPVGGARAVGGSEKVVGGSTNAVGGSPDPHTTPTEGLPSALPDQSSKPPRSRRPAVDPVGRSGDRPTTRDESAVGGAEVVGGSPDPPTSPTEGLPDSQIRNRGTRQGGSSEIRNRLSSAVTFIGTGGPRMMLTQEPEYDYPYFAFIVVNTTDATLTADYAQAVSNRLAGIHNARVTVEQFMLGPPIKDPVAFRLSGPDTEVLREKAEQMIRIFKETPGTWATRSDWGTTGYQLKVQIDPYAANLSGVNNKDVALTTRSLLSGALLTTYREGDHLVPVMLRTLRNKRERLDDLSGIFVNGATDKVPIESIAVLEPTWKPAVIARRNNIRTVTVGCRVDEGVLANSVAAEIKPRLEKMMKSLPVGYFLEQGGEHEETLKAQTQVVMAVFIAILLIVLILVVQYNSLLKPLVILFTVPMAMIGVLIGLWLTGWAMGFMAMLGVLSLIGIVINNAIVLIDFIESNVAQGQELRAAVAAAGRVRMRPIILTSLTTIGGLLPLSLFGGALWAPMTNGMIFGLIFSTVLTLVVVPTLYVLFAEKLGMKVV